MGGRRGWFLYSLACFRGRKRESPLAHAGIWQRWHLLEAPWRHLSMFGLSGVGLGTDNEQELSQTSPSKRRRMTLFAAWPSQRSPSGPAHKMHPWTALLTLRTTCMAFVSLTMQRRKNTKAKSLTSPDRPTTMAQTY